MQMPNSIPTSNPSFVRLLQNIQKVIPQIMFIWILITYAITSVISIYFIPLPLWITIPIALIIQGSRFLVVFMNFLNNPTIFKSDMPSKIALFATILALVELLLTLMNRNATITENASIYLFFGNIILFGYFIEVHFIKMGELVLLQPIIPEVVVKKNGLNQLSKNPAELV
jgi:hypothetical protein